MRWFYKLPVRRKQLLALFLSEALSVIGLVGVGAMLMVANGRSQLINQAKTEVEVTEMTYNTRLNQMSFGFRGQSENPAIVTAAREAMANRPVPADIQQQVKRVLGGEVAARNIEYATLVGKDGRFVANANADRARERFDPEGLVTTVLKTGRQQQANALISAAELQKESPQTAAGLTQRDSLIRYVATAVRDPNTQEVIGVLVAGDVVKQAVVEDTIAALSGGYSAVYAHEPNGGFSLITSLRLPDSGNSNRPQRGLPLPDSQILQQATKALGSGATAGERVVQRLSLDGQTYTVAAQALPGSDGEPVAVLVRGTSEAALDKLLRDSLTLQLLIAAIAIAADVALAGVLGRSIVSPIENLRRITQRFTQGDRQARAEVFAPDEVGNLTTSFNELADHIVESEVTLQQQSTNRQAEAERAILIADLTSRIRSLLDRDKIFNVVVKEVRETLVADRTTVYLFDEKFQGTFVAESLQPGYPDALGSQVTDPCFIERYVEKYRKGRVQATNDIYNAGLTECHLRQLEPFQVRANLVVPIIQQGELLGLLIVHQCSGPRIWQDFDIDFCRQVAIQLGYALEQTELYSLREASRLESESLSEERRQQKEALQMQLINLLSEVEGASQGDLTVRAEVTAGEIGTVADFFNSIIENLRQIVIQVKQAAAQVNNSLGENEGAVRRLADEAIRQAEETTCTLDSVEQMTRSIEQVAINARQAAQVARMASVTAETGGTAMDLTVQNILELRETVGETTKKVKRLGESSQQISRVVALINQIAMQTNLLAINAGIEAARAGAEGQGFAVVAEEVGELAARSAAATQEIEKIVETIQRETSLVVEAMEQSTSQVVEGTHRVEEAKQSLNQIVEVSRQIDELVQAISEATVSQVETSTIVSKLMQEVAAISGQTSSSSHQVSEAIRKTVEVARTLEASVGMFETGEER
jgi:twitching motility protein PilJ